MSLRQDSFLAWLQYSSPECSMPDWGLSRHQWSHGSLYTLLCCYLYWQRRVNPPMTKGIYIGVAIHPDKAFFWGNTGF